jgi:hypothetical protein
MFGIWTSSKTGSLVFPADQVPEVLRTGGAASVLERAHWFGQKWCEQVELSPHGRDAHAPLLLRSKDQLAGLSLLIWNIVAISP